MSFSPLFTRHSPLKEPTVPPRNIEHAKAAGPPADKAQQNYKQSTPADWAKNQAEARPNDANARHSPSHPDCVKSGY